MKYEIWGGGKLWFTYSTKEEAEKRLKGLEKLLILSFEIRECWI